MFPSSEALARYRANRYPDIKVTQGTWQFLKWAGVQTLRGLTLSTAEVRQKVSQRFGKKVETPVEVKAEVLPEVLPEVRTEAVVEASAHPGVSHFGEQMAAITAPGATAGVQAQAALPHLASTPMPMMPQSATQARPVHVHAAGQTAVPRVAVPVSPFASGGAETARPATPMQPVLRDTQSPAPGVAASQPLRAVIPAPSLAPVALDLAVTALPARAPAIAVPRALPVPGASVPALPVPAPAAEKPAPARAREVPLS
jgi:hypothetical protein